jgi:hypothetical protein
MESHATHRALAHRRSALQDLDSADLEQTMRDAMHSEEKDLLAHMDEQTYRLHLAFVHAHGTPRGEFTTFMQGGRLSMHKPCPDRSHSRS